MAPFIAIQSLNMDKARYSLKDMFPSVQWIGLQRALQQFLRDHITRLFPTERKLLEEIDQNLSSLLDQSNVNSTKFADSISTLIQKSIRDSDSLAKLKPPLEKFFNSHFREYDHVILGKTIGLTVIEVKHSPFTQKKHFKDGNKFLPDDFLHGLEQLRSFDAVIDLLNECAGNDIKITDVREILFMPNLEKIRFDRWYASLDPTAQSEVDKRLKMATQI